MYKKFAEIYLFCFFISLPVIFMAATTYGIDEISFVIFGFGVLGAFTLGPFILGAASYILYRLSKDEPSSQNKAIGWLTILFPLIWVVLIFFSE